MDILDQQQLSSFDQLKDDSIGHMAGSAGGHPSFNCYLNAGRIPRLVQGFNVMGSSRRYALYAHLSYSKARLQAQPCCGEDVHTESMCHMQWYANEMYFLCYWKLIMEGVQEAVRIIHEPHQDELNGNWTVSLLEGWRWQFQKLVNRILPTPSITAPPPPLHAIIYLIYDCLASKHTTLTQYWFNFGSGALGQRQRVLWVVTFFANNSLHIFFALQVQHPCKQELWIRCLFNVVPTL